MTKKVIEPRKEAELTLSFAKKSGADLIKSTKKLTGYRPAKFFSCLCYQ